MFVSEILTHPPQRFESVLQEKIYHFLAKNAIAFERVENDPARTMEDCKEVSKKLGSPIAKTLFLCNRQQTKFYLYLMPEDKPFVTRDFSKSLDIARVSFASEAFLKEKMGVEPGAATLFCLLLESASDVQLVIDKKVLDVATFGCTDGSFCSYMKLKTEDVTGVILPALDRAQKRIILEE